MEATILVPTHDHGELLELSVATAKDQTVTDIEVFIIGDGVDDVTRAVAHRIAGSDGRVRFFDNPKGPRHGEIYRHAALEEASGRVICYLGDDDLYLPSHVEHMLDLLDTVDFAHSMPVGILPDGRAQTWVGHLSIRSSVEAIVSHRNFIPLTCAAHTIDLYRRLPHGWQTTPGETPTDVYMWSQILETPGVSHLSSDRVTALAFPSPWRHEMSKGERLSELGHWRQRAAEPGIEAAITRLVIEDLSRHTASMSEQIEVLSQLPEAVSALQSSIAAKEREILGLTGSLADLKTRLSDRETEVDELLRQVETLGEEISERDQVIVDSGNEIVDLESKLTWILASRTWRARERLLDLPGLGAALRWAGRARVR